MALRTHLCLVVRGREQLSAALGVSQQRERVVRASDSRKGEHERAAKAEVDRRSELREGGEVRVTRRLEELHARPPLAAEHRGQKVLHRLGLAQAARALQQSDAARPVVHLPRTRSVKSATARRTSAASREQSRDQASRVVVRTHGFTHTHAFTGRKFDAQVLTRARERQRAVNAPERRRLGGRGATVDLFSARDYLVDEYVCARPCVRVCACAGVSDHARACVIVRV
eukprot:3234490-Pleurochrysis_carterae.AAC.2